MGLFDRKKQIVCKVEKNVEAQRQMLMKSIDTAAMELGRVLEAIIRRHVEEDAAAHQKSEAILIQELLPSSKSKTVGPTHKTTLFLDHNGSGRIHIMDMKDVWTVTDKFKTHETLKKFTKHPLLKTIEVNLANKDVRVASSMVYNDPSPGQEIPERLRTSFYQARVEIFDLIVNRAIEQTFARIEYGSIVPPGKGTGDADQMSVDIDFYSGPLRNTIHSTVCLENAQRILYMNVTTKIEHSKTDNFDFTNVVRIASSPPSKNSMSSITHRGYRLVRSSENDDL